MVKELDEAQLGLIKRLVERLERLSADSTYAHRASGLRGTLLRLVERIESGCEVSKDEIEGLTEYGFELLEGAAKELGGSR